MQKEVLKETRTQMEDQSKMTGRMTRQVAFLKDVSRAANQNKRQQKPCYASADQINAMSELVMDTLRGTVRPGRKTVPKLRPYSKQPRLIASPRQSIKKDVNS